MHSNYEEMKKDFTEVRPWGGYKILDEGPGYKVKRLFVLPGQKLSLQLHHHRNEHWIGVGGVSKLTIGEETVILEPGKNVFIPMYGDNITKTYFGDYFIIYTNIGSLCLYI